MVRLLRNEYSSLLQTLVRQRRRDKSVRDRIHKVAGFKMETI